MKVRIDAACRIALTSPEKINEAHSLGHFRCLPKTRAGQARLFGVDDLIALRVFAMFRENGYSAKIAGSLACEVRGALKYIPDPETTDMRVDIPLLPFFGPAQCVADDRTPDSMNDAVLNCASASFFIRHVYVEMKPRIEAELAGAASTRPKKVQG